MNKTIEKTMNKTIPAEMLPIVVRNPFLQLNARGTTALLHSAEFRLLSIAHNAQRHCAELSLYRNEQISKASLPEVFWSRLAPFEGQAIRIDYHQSASGHEPLQLIQYLAVVDKAKDPLATILPLWLECGQKDLYRELARLINLLEWPYRELVREVFRSDDLLQALQFGGHGRMLFRLTVVDFIARN